MRNSERTSMGMVVLGVFAVACGSSGRAGTPGSGGVVSSAGGAGQSARPGSGGTNSTSKAGASGSGGQASSTGGLAFTDGGRATDAPELGGDGGGGGTGDGGTRLGVGGVPSGGISGTGGAAAGATTSSGGAAGAAIGSGGSAWAGSSGTASGSGGTPQSMEVLVTSAVDAYWQAGTATEASNATANVTVLDDVTAQTWDGFGGAFNELGWSKLTSKAMQDQAVRWLFDSKDGANFAWALVPIGATDYATSRYTLDDTGDDATPNAEESNRPAADPTLNAFSLERDLKLLIPYIKAAQGVKSDLRFWAAPWTPPVWMKSSYKKTSSNGTGSTPAPRPSYYDGGNMRSDNAILSAYAQYFAKFVRGYKEHGIDIAVVAPQNEPTFDQNSPSCIWDKTTMTTFVGKYLGPAMVDLKVEVMLGDLANSTTGTGDVDLAAAVLADPAAAGFVKLVGVEWDVLDKVNSGTRFGALPIWATTHKFGNYPFCSSARLPSCPAPYDSTQAPNDHAYGVESWGYIRNAITKGRVSVYNAWNMVLDKSGLGIDTGRDWKQDTLLVADGDKVTATPAYYVFRHLSQFAVPGAVVVGTSGGDAVAFKNPDGSLVAVAYNSGAAITNFVIGIGGKKLQFAMPANGWATIKHKP